MSPELDELLCRRYPLIFAQRNWPDSCMGRGFECGDGWFDLIDVLCESIQSLIDSDGLPQAVAVQVKEKFGTLRFRINGASPEIRGMVRMAESMSARICELCGKPETGGEMAGRRNESPCVCATRFVAPMADN